MSILSGLFAAVLIVTACGGWSGGVVDASATDRPRRTSFEWTGDRVSGSLTPDDADEEADPIEVGFDVPVPPDVHDCSL